MAKDGTSRGGARIGAGKKRKPLADKILEGADFEGTALFPDDELEGAEIPKPRDYLTAKQKGGGKLCSEQIYNDTWLWLKKHGCENFVPKNLIEQYAQMSGRLIFCEMKLSEYGMLAKHPTTGEAILSPFHKASLDYLKSSNQLWYQIFQVVKDNCAEGYGGTNPQDDLMELMLTARKVGKNA